MTFQNNGGSCYSSDDELENTDSSIKNDLKNSIIHFDDTQSKNEFFNFLKTAYQSEIMCDVTIEIKPQTFQAHKLVLSAASKRLFDLFKTDPKSKYFSLNQIEANSFEILLNYAYTYKLKLDPENVIPIYNAAIYLQIDSAAEACSKFLASHLTTSSCLNVRHFARQLTDSELATETKAYIQNNIKEILSESPVDSIQVDVLGPEQSLQNTEMNYLGQIVVKWLKKMVTDNYFQQEYLLCIDSNKVLRDVNQIGEEEDISSMETVIDYKAQQKKKQVLRSEKSPPNIANCARQISSTDEFDEVIAIHNVSNNYCVVLADFNDNTYRISLKYEQLKPKNVRRDSFSECDKATNFHQMTSLVPLATMQFARAGLGVVKLDEDHLAAIGGYDRAYCMNSGEIYNVKENSWSPMCNMTSARARFNVAELNGLVYACGGSDGNKELYTAEAYDPLKNEWLKLPPMNNSRLFSGVISLNDAICVIGGWAYTGLVECEMYKPSVNKWFNMKSMNVGRSQVAVCSIGNCKVFAAGGSDGFNCLQAVEIYDNSLDEWEMVAPLMTARRGAGAAVFENKIYIVGGSDSQNSLSSVEIYDIKNNCWFHGPNLKHARTNLGLTVVGDSLWAVGGFSGKEFLNSIEVLRKNESEWSSFISN